MRFLFFLCVFWSPWVFADSQEPFSKALFEWINQYREEQKLSPLIWDETLAQLAFKHSSRMNEKQTLSHDGFESRFHATQKKVCVENVGVRFQTAKGQGEAWKNSPQHNANLLRKEIRHCGLAKAGEYVTFLATD